MIKLAKENNNYIYVSPGGGTQHVFRYRCMARISKLRGLPTDFCF